MEDNISKNEMETEMETKKRNRKRILKSLCFKSLRRRIRFYPHESASEIFNKDRLKTNQLFAEWKKYKKMKKSNIDFESFKLRKKNIRKRVIDNKNFFLKFDCEESFPSWFFFLPEMKKVYGNNDLKFKYVIIQNGENLDEKINFVMEIDNGDTFERVFQQYIKKRPKNHLISELGKEKQELFHFYYKLFDKNVDKTNIPIAFVESKLSDQKIIRTKFIGQFDSIISFEDEDVISLPDLLHRIKLKKIVNLKIMLDNYDSVILKHILAAQNDWYKYMSKYKTILKNSV